MGLFDKFKKNKNELLKENVDTNIAAIPAQPFDESRLEAEKLVEMIEEEPQPTPVVEVKKEAIQEDVEVLDPGVDLNQVGICKNCGQKIVPGSTVCFLCGKPVK